MRRQHRNEDQRRAIDVGGDADAACRQRRPDSGIEHGKRAKARRTQKGLREPDRLRVGFTNDVFFFSTLAWFFSMLASLPHDTRSKEI